MMLRIILENDGDESGQLSAALMAISDGIQIGGVWDVKIVGKAYGVRRNILSVRVYPQDSREDA